MSTSTWTNSDTESACRIWAEYQHDHDVSGLIGQVAGIDPVNGRVWFGESAAEIGRQRHAEGLDSPFYSVRVGYDYYLRKGKVGHRAVPTHSSRSCGANFPPLRRVGSGGWSRRAPRPGTRFRGCWTPRNYRLGRSGSCYALFTPPNPPFARGRKEAPASSGSATIPRLDRVHRS